MLNTVHEGQWSKLSRFVSERMGLHFPPERWDDLQRGFAGAAQEFGFEDPAECIGWLLSTPPTRMQLQVLANHLTIGETYFFREPQTFRALADSILPELIRARRDGEKRLRIWSAACCSGEEPYSLAILLHQALHDFSDWRITITATDINARFLHAAAAGVYREWSFRNAPSWLKERYFSRTKDGRYVIIPEIKELVTFAHLNLVEDVYPSLATDTNAMDLILCRNVLMYFTPEQIRKVIVKLHHCLIEDGWLAVSPSEASKTLFPEFASVNFSGAILFRKKSTPFHIMQTPAQSDAISEPVVATYEEPVPWVTPPPAVDASPAPAGDAADFGTELPRPLAMARSLYEEGRYAEAADALLATTAGGDVEPTAYSLLARSLANQGKLADALEWCDRWVTAEKLDPAGHYLRAVVLLEHGNPEEANAALRRSIYLDPEFVLAHFTLGNLARRRGRSGEADKHFANALQWLRRHRPEDPLPESDGLTAGRLIETITSMIEATP